MSYEAAARQFGAEVEAEAERLIERGMAQWDAIRGARIIVSDRRSQAVPPSPAGAANPTT